MREPPKEMNFGLRANILAEAMLHSVKPRDSATVILVRHAVKGLGTGELEAEGLEVFLQRRASTMAFASGMLAFPGGSVDSRDFEPGIDWVGPAPQLWANWWRCEPTLAKALVCAAVRETFEECGVLLAGKGSTVLESTNEYADERRRLISGELSLAEFFASAGLALRADLLKPWANWVTPAFAPRRYDTRFFLATVPKGQTADGQTTEVDHAGWRPISSVLSE